MHLHPLGILLALTAGGLLAGLMGAFLAVPLLAVGTAMVKQWRSMAPEPQDSEPDDLREAAVEATLESSGPVAARAEIGGPSGTDT